MVDVSPLQHWYLITSESEYLSIVTLLICGHFSMIWCADTWLLQHVSIPEINVTLLFWCVYFGLLITSASELIVKLILMCVLEIIIDTWLFQFVSIPAMSHYYCHIVLNSCFYDLMCLLWNINILYCFDQEVSIHTVDIIIMFWTHISMIWCIYHGTLNNIDYFSMILWVSQKLVCHMHFWSLCSYVSTLDHWYLITSASELICKYSFWLSTLKHWYQEVSILQLSYCWYLVFWIHVSMIWCVYFRSLILHYRKWVFQKCHMVDIHVSI